MGHIVGQPREQSALFPEALDDFISADHPVRVIDAFVNALDLGALSFSKVVSKDTGRPPYHPGDLLKLYVYGYLNQIRSSRRLERESQRNIEVLWLLSRLSPDFKTIAAFRQENTKALVGVCRTFTRFCRESALFGAELVAIDGSKFQAVASRKAVYTQKRIERERARIDARIGEYLTAMDEADANEACPEQKTDTQAALKGLRERADELQTMAVRMRVDGVNQHVSTEPEARLMRTAGGGHAVSYNVQTAVDAMHKLIVSHEVTNEGNDHRQLYPMASAAKAELGVDTLTVVADTGYQNGEQGSLCEATGVTAVVPSQQVVNPQGDYFDKSQFVYDAQSNTYRCPAGAVLSVRRTDRQAQVRVYGTSACGSCVLRAQCTRSKARTINRHFYAKFVEMMNQRAVDQPERMRQRHAIVEHPFGNIKRMMGNPRFLMRGLIKVRAEMALSVLSYNLKRVINIIGVPMMLVRLGANAA